MSIKKIIGIIIIIVGIGGAGIMLYSAFVGSRVKVSNLPRPTLPGEILEENTGSTILPRGNDLDFSQIKKYNPNRNTFPYPVVNSNEVGAPIGNIIK